MYALLGGNTSVGVEALLRIKFDGSGGRSSELGASDNDNDLGEGILIH